MKNHFTLFSGSLLVASFLIHNVFLSTAHAQPRPGGPAHFAPPAPPPPPPDQVDPQFTRPERGDRMSTVAVDIGESRGALNLGASYQREIVPAVSLGAFIFNQNSQDSANNKIVNQVTSLGVLAYVHLLPPTLNIDVYFAPGIAVNWVKDVPNFDIGNKGDKVLYGPAFKMGAQYRFCKFWKAGLESTTLVNWTNGDGNATFNTNSPMDHATFYSAVVSYDL